MPFTGDSFAHLFDWEKDPQRQEKIINARLEAEFDGVDTGLSAVAARVTVVEGESNAPTNAQYLALATDATLTAERVLVPGGGLTGTDGGAGGNYTLAVGAGTGITVNADDVALNVASQGEAEAGTSSTKAMTPERTAQAIAALQDGWIMIGSPQTASTSATIDFASGSYAAAFDGTYDRLMIVVSSAVPATDDVELWIRVEVASAYQTSGYKWIQQLIATSDGVATQGSASDAKIKMGNNGASGAWGNAATESLNATITFDNPDNTARFCNFSIDALGVRADDQPTKGTCGGYYGTAGAVTGVRLMFESGNIASGWFAIYGLRKT